MKIGLLSDTHGYLDPGIFHHFKDCDELWHAGDIGDISSIETLVAFKPVKAVYGNIDTKQIQLRYPENLQFNCEGFNIFITHIGGKPSVYNPRVRKILMNNTPDIFICGHSHMLLIKRDINFNNMLFINPGAAGNQGFHRVKTLIRFELNDKKLEKMEVIELGKRGDIDRLSAQNL